MIQPSLFEAMMNYRKVMQSSLFNQGTQASNTSNLFIQLFSSYLSGQQSQSALNPQLNESQTMSGSNQLPYTHSTVSPVALKQLSSTQEASGLDQLINQTAEKYGLDSNLLHKVIETESNYDPNAVSGAGAAGLMQLMPATAQALGVNNVFDPAQKR